MSLRAPWLVAAMLASACATPPRAAPCPPVAMAWKPRPLPKPAENSFGPCMRVLPTVGSDLVPYGRDLDQVLYCIALYYRGPDGVPTDRMLASALQALARVYPATRTSTSVNRLVLDAEVRAGAVPLTLEALTALLLRVARATYLEVPRDAAAQNRPPEDLLIAGALAALQWETQFRRPPIPDGPRQASFTASSRDGIAYIRVPRLEPGAVRQIRSELFARRVSGAILDLRGDQGGLLNEALGLTDLFLRDGCVATTRPPIPEPFAPALTQRDDIDAPIVVLVDHDTASGAELVAATLRARGRAIVVGEHTHGSAILHTVVKLESGALLKLPLGELLAADGTPIQGRGIQPDVTLGSVAPSDAMNDDEIERAMQILRHARGRRRADLLQAARAIAPPHAP